MFSDANAVLPAVVDSTAAPHASSTDNTSYPCIAPQKVDTDKAWILNDTGGVQALTEALKLKGISVAKAVDI